MSGYRIGTCRGAPSILLVLFGLLLAGPAQAARFGTDESIHRIEDVKLKGAKDEPLYLGYVTRIRWFGGGIYVEDGGYVLGVQGNSKRFYPMPEGEALKRFQRDGFLPDPLPKYSLSFFDYLFGYSLWIVLAGVGLFWLVSKFRKPGGAAAEQTMPPTPGTPDTPGTPPGPSI